MARTIYEAAKDPTNFSDQDLKEIVLHDRAEKERPLLVTREPRACALTLEKLNLDTQVAYGAKVVKIEEGDVNKKSGVQNLGSTSLEDVINQPMKDVEKKDEDEEDLGDTYEESFNPNLRVVDLPQQVAQDMFVMIGGGGNPDDYDAYGKWVGVVGGKGKKNNRKKGKKKNKKKTHTPRADDKTKVVDATDYIQQIKEKILGLQIQGATSDGAKETNKNLREMEGKVKEISIPTLPGAMDILNNNAFTLEQKIKRIQQICER